MGFLVSQHGQLGAIPPPPFLSISPLESMQSGGAIPNENKANGYDTPLCDTISQRYCAIWGVFSHWAAKFEPSSRHFVVMKSPEFCSEFFYDLLRFVSGEAETTKISPKMPAIFNAKSPGNLEERKFTNVSGEQAAGKVTLRWNGMQSATVSLKQGDRQRVLEALTHV